MADNIEMLSQPGKQNNNGSPERVFPNIATQSTRTNLDDRQDVPPHYQQTVPDDIPPPSYESVFGKLKRIQSESVDKVKCTDNIGAKICSVVARFVAFVLFLGVPLSMLVIGILYRDECPAAWMVPMYLIVAGSTTCFYFITIVIRKVYKKCTQEPKVVSGGAEDGQGADVAPSEAEKSIEHPLCKAYDGLVTSFLIVWFIAGNYFVYSSWAKRPCNSLGLSTVGCEGMYDFCNPVPLVFSFWMITAIYITCGCCTCTGICLGCLLL